MCGIAGIVAENAKDHAGCLDRMVNALSHRGPDGSGTAFFRNCGLGHTRLSIVDLATGRQPMHSRDSQVGITFNGEIYGYKDIRKNLGEFPFSSTSDTEVILALYLKYGAALFSHLPGMFAFGLWDERNGELMCARDRFGEKPLYYAFGRQGEFLFASEIKAIIASGLVTPLLDRDALAHYMTYLYVPVTRTIYSNIYTVPPAHLLRYAKGKVHIERYWTLPPIRSDMSIDDALLEFSRLLEQAVVRQLVADVPVGAFLSGGLDSSTIVHLASRHHSRLKTYSFGFEEESSELGYARDAAELYKTEHIELSEAGFDIAELLLTMQDVYDEPFADSSNIPTYLISKLARKHMKVILTGDGADELLAGYQSWYAPLANMDAERTTPVLVAGMLRCAGRLAGRLGVTFGSTLQKRIQGVNYRSKFDSIATAHAAQKMYFSRRDLEELGLDFPDSYQAEVLDCSGTLDDALRMDIVDYMPGDILVKTDRASMANGLELRAPFLDVDFASFCISLPHQMKISERQDKIILRRAFAESWPATVRARGKQGFGAPVSKWLGLPSVRSLKEKYLDDPRRRIFSLIRFDQTRELTSRRDYRTWILLVLALWMEKREFLIEGTET